MQKLLEPPLVNDDVVRVEEPGYVVLTFVVEFDIKLYWVEVKRLERGTVHEEKSPDFIPNNKNWSDTFIFPSLFKS